MSRLLPLVLVTACSFNVQVAGDGGGSNSDGNVDDAPLPDANPDLAPRLIPGGGVKDAPIGSVVHVYVIDEITQAPITGAAVVVAGATKMTDATGLASFEDPALVGKQAIVVTKAAYRAAYWVGVNGANVTIPLATSAPSTVPRADVSGQVTAWTSLPNNGTDHSRAGYTSYSTLDKLPAAVNGMRNYNFNFGQGELSNYCYGDDDCPFKMPVRTGPVALFATIFDYDDNNTTPRTDDVLTFMAFAERRNVTVANGVALTGQDLTVIPAASLTTLQVSFGSAPYAFQLANVAIELGPQGVVTLENSTTANAGVTVPQLAYFAPDVATYRVIATSSTAAPSSFGGFSAGTVNPTNGSTSKVILRGIAAPNAVEVTGWMSAPTTPVVTHTAASWTPVPGAKIASVDVYTRSGGPTPMTTRILQTLVFDETGSVTWPAEVTLPGGMFSAVIGARRGSVSVLDFSFADDAAKFDAYSATDTIAVP